MRRKKSVSFKFDDRPLTPAEKEFYAGFTLDHAVAKASRAMEARRLAQQIRQFMHHLPSDVMTELHNAAYALDEWAVKEQQSPHVDT